jgi:hypothetical protein
MQGTCAGGVASLDPRLGSGLKDKSKKPEYSPNRKIFEKQGQWILKLRDEMNIGAHRIQNELVRQ